MDKKRYYHILLHLHTVSGIVISVALFIMFFAGAFSMFKKEIGTWEKGGNHHVNIQNIDFDRIMTDLSKNYNLTARNINFNFTQSPDDIYVFVDHSHAPNAPAEDLETHVLFVDTRDYTLNTYEEHYHYAEFIYRLHFLSQIPEIGIYLAGFVSFFFLFALLTGLYIHWDKLVQNFILLRTKANWKTFWKDSHTVLGTIALPFQLLFAVSGAYFCLSLLILLPAYYLYDNDYEKLMNDMRPERAHAEWEQETDQEPQSIQAFVSTHYQHFDDFEIRQLSIENINGTNMEYELVGELKEQIQFTGLGSYAVDAFSLEKLHENNPQHSPYVSNVQRFMSRLHFGDFGGVYLKFVYAFLAFLTCFIILSGVMIWFTARDKKNIPDQKRRFNQQVVHVYMAICLSMIPVTAIGFISAKLLPSNFIGNQQHYYYAVYFIAWLVMSMLFIYKNRLDFTLKTSVLTGGILFMMVPIVNGVVSGKWIWQTVHHDGYAIFLVDFFCLMVGVISIITFYALKKQPVKTLS